MKWKRGHQSSNVEDRRGSGGARLGGAGGKLGIGGILVVGAVVLLTGGDLQQVLGLLGGGGSASQSPGGPRPANDEAAQFVGFTLDDIQSTWQGLLGARYRPAKLVLFSGSTPTTCGRGHAAIGPFYCPPDEKVYIDLSFFRELATRFGAPGDFAQAYVIAHEIGHHVQNLTSALGAGKKNRESIAVELQADCYAGVWAHHADSQRDLLERGDLEEGLGAAAAVGDDTLQRQSGGQVMPETWTHGSSADRQSWFRRGFDSGDPAACAKRGG